MIRGKISQQPGHMIAAEERQRAFARNLDLEQARVTAFFVHVVWIPDDLAWSGQPYQGAISIPDARRPQRAANFGGRN